MQGARLFQNGLLRHERLVICGGRIGTSYSGLAVLESGSRTRRINSSSSAHFPTTHTKPILPSEGIRQATVLCRRWNTQIISV